jgi:hypothetical protein
MTKQETLDGNIQGMMEPDPEPVTSGDVKAAWIVVAALFTALFLLV